MAKFTVSTDDVVYNVLKRQGLAYKVVFVPDVGSRIAEFELDEVECVKYKKCFISREIGEMRNNRTEDGVNSTRYKTLGEKF